MTVRIGYALAMAAAAGAPVRVAGPLMDQLAVPAQGDLRASSPGASRCHGGVADCRACSAGTRRYAWRLADDRLTAVRVRKAPGLGQGGWGCRCVR
jgi:hypothetical protein